MCVYAYGGHRKAIMTLWCNGVIFVEVFSMCLSQRCKKVTICALREEGEVKYAGTLFTSGSQLPINERNTHG